MARAAVLIGANRTGHLPALQDAAAGARRMAQWALAQGMAPHRVRVFTDEAGPIDVAAIRRAIRELVDSGALEQLIVYFAGHGVNIRYGEYWLLSDAPEDASAAVNVEGSVVLARRCGIGHVVFISDACRTAAEGVQAQGVTGTEIFPNDPVPGPEHPVDLFFAATLGRPALEVKDPAVSTAAFKGIYTAALVDAISGQLPQALTRIQVQGEAMDVVRPRPLKALLLAELPRRLAALRLPLTVTQVPDARITSDDNAWLARIKPPVAPTPTAAPIAPVIVTPEAQAQTRLAAALDVSAPVPPAAPPSRGAAAAGAVLRRLRHAGPPPPTPTKPTGDETEDGLSFDTGCGLQVAGGEVREASSSQARAERTPDPTRVRVHLPHAAPGAVVLLRLQDDSGTLLPALRGFVTRLRIEDGELADVAFEPLRGTPRWPAFAAAAPALHALREVVSEAARENTFRPEPDVADRLAERMVYGGHLDPALALYAVHAWHELQRADRIPPLARALRDDLGVDLFDLDLLSPVGARTPCPPGTPRLPPVPLLSRGWALLSALGAPLPAGLAGIERHLLPSLWTHFDREGCDRLQDLIATRRLP